MSGSESCRGTAGDAADSACFRRFLEAGETLGVRRGGRTLDREQLEEQTGSVAEGAQQLGGYTVIAPNLTRRNQLLKNANKELEDLAKLKEQHRSGLITLTPRRLGGETSEAEVRQKQQLEHIQSKYQQKLKKDEYQRIKREAEEAEIMRKKMIQREKANKLEEKQRKQERERQQMFADDHYLKNTELFNKLSLGPSSRTSCKPNHCNPESTAWARSHSYKQMQREEENKKLQEMRDAQRRKAELLELKHRQEEKIRTKAHQNKQERVNNTFLDKLQNNHHLGDTYQSGLLGNTDFSIDSWEFEYEQ